MHFWDSRHADEHMEEPEIHVEMDPITALPVPLRSSTSTINTHGKHDPDDQEHLRVHRVHDVVDFRRSSIPSLTPAIPEPEPGAAVPAAQHTSSLLAAVGVLIFYCFATIADQQLLKNVFSEDFYAPFLILYINNLMRLLVLPIYVLCVKIKSHIGRGTKRKSIRQILRECSIFKSPDPLPIFFIKTIGILGSNIVLAVSLSIIALSYATASEVACVQTTQVAMVYFAAVAFFGQEVLFAKVLAVFTSLSGVAVIAYAKGFHSSSSLGIGLSLIATSIFCFNIMYYKHVYKRLTFGQCCCFLTTAASFTVSIFWTLPLWTKMTYAEIWTWETIPWKWMIMSGICSLFAAKLMNYGLVIATPLIMSFGSLLRIPGNMGIDHFLRHVEFSHLEITGSILIILGFVLIVIPDDRVSIKCPSLLRRSARKARTDTG